MNIISSKDNEFVKSIKKLKDKKIDLIISSPLKRAKETAEIISDGKIKIITDSLIVERGLGEYEGSPVNDNGYNADFYWNYKLNSDEKGVESVRDLLDRAQLFLDKIKQEYDNKNIKSDPVAETNNPKRAVFLLPSFFDKNGDTSPPKMLATRPIEVTTGIIISALKLYFI